MFTGFFTLSHCITSLGETARSTTCIFITQSNILQRRSACLGLQVRHERQDVLRCRCRLDALRDGGVGSDNDAHLRW